jgi:hypothetical protein
MKRLTKQLAFGLAGVPLMAGSLSAVPLDSDYRVLGIEETLYQSGDLSDASLLAPRISMAYESGVLYIKLQNLTADAAGSSAGVLLSGLAFNLPGNVAPSGGSNPGDITPLGTTGGGWVHGETGDEVQWGYDFAQGGASGGALAYAANSYDTIISTLGSNGKNVFGGSAANSDGLNYGVFSLAESSTTPGPYVKDTLLITFNLNLGGFGGDLVDAIDRGNVAAIFGSPNGVPVPDGGMTLLLLGGSLLVLGALGRRPGHRA